MPGLDIDTMSTVERGPASCIIISFRSSIEMLWATNRSFASLPRHSDHSHKGPKDTAGHSIIATISACCCVITQMTQQMQQRESFHYDFHRTIVWTCTSIALLLSRLSFSWEWKKQRRVMQDTSTSLWRRVACSNQMIPNRLSSASLESKIILLSLVVSITLCGACREWRKW